jgi:hypothetical protein
LYDEQLHAAADGLWESQCSEVRHAAVERVEVEAWRAEADQRVRVVDLLQDRQRVERDVVVDELPEVRSRRDRRCR